MRPVCVAIIALLSAFAVGCLSSRASAPDSFLYQGLQNSVQSPIRDFDEAVFIKVTRVQAEHYWSEFCQNSDKSFPKAYHRGFVEGFVDYVEAGGNGEPPYLPPFRYRLTLFRTPDGVAAIEDWYAGFRHGAAIAKESGLREYSYVPLPGYAIPKDLNSNATTETVKPASLKQKPVAEGSPWDQPGNLPMPRPLPTKADQVPSAPQPRTIPIIIPEAANRPLPGADSN